MLMGGPAWCKFRFRTAIEVHYFTFTLANDFPGRDPTEWTVEFTTSGGKFTEEFISKSKDTSRYAQEIFWLKEPRTVTEINFIFKKNRYTSTGD